MVNIPCKNCGTQILVDGTLPPPPAEDGDAVLNPAIPKQPSLPAIDMSIETPGGTPLPPAREKL